MEATSEPDAKAAVRSIRLIYGCRIAVGPRRGHDQRGDRQDHAAARERRASGAPGGGAAKIRRGVDGRPVDDADYADADEDGGGSGAPTRTAAARAAVQRWSSTTWLRCATPPPHRAPR